MISSGPTRMSSGSDWSHVDGPMRFAAISRKVWRTCLDVDIGTWVTQAEIDYRAHEFDDGTSVDAGIAVMWISGGRCRAKACEDGHFSK